VKVTEEGYQYRRRNCQRENLIARRKHQSKKRNVIRNGENYDIENRKINKQ